MPVLVWKKHSGSSYVWGCEECVFAVPKPRIGESIGEYIVASRNALDRHKCQDYPRERIPQASGLLLVKKAANGL